MGNITCIRNSHTNNALQYLTNLPAATEWKVALTLLAASGAADSECLDFRTQ
jgi:hypothetical protein